MSVARTHAARERQAVAAADAVLAGRPQAGLGELAQVAPKARTAGGGTGAPLPPALLDDMERRYARDFASGRIHTDADADRTARGFGARVFAHGESVSFAAGQYRPHEAAGRALIAHELTHVLQQRADGRARIDRDGTSLDAQVMALRIEILEAEDAEARKPLVAKAKTLAATLSVALEAAKQADPPDGGSDGDEARTLIQLLGGALADREQETDAIAIAKESADAKAQAFIIDALPDRTSVAGQQARLAQVSGLGPESIKADAKPTDKNSRQSLAANAGKVGRTLSALDEQGIKGRRRSSRSLEMTESLLKGYLVHSDEDERPDPTGNPTGASVRTDAKTAQIRADCDVYATIGARLLREQGWGTVGYMVLVPQEKDPNDPANDRAAHAVALTRKPVDATDAAKGDLYVGISNFELRELGGEGHAITAEADAMELLVAQMFDVYATPQPQVWDIYYAPAGANGAYDMRLLDPANNGITPWRSAGKKAPSP